MQDIREQIKTTYAKAIRRKTSCNGDSSACCGAGQEATRMITGNLYNPAELENLPKDLIQTSFGCGNPTALAKLYPGERVLDLGSGAGLDVLLSARRVGSTGKAYGLDMTDEMLAEARENQRKTGIINAEFLKGHLESIPLPDNGIDVIISNCVINLSPDKDQALREAYRVLRPSGRFAVSDIVITKSLPESLLKEVSAWAGCISGAMQMGEYRDRLEKAGFEDISIEVTRTYDLTSNLAAGALPALTANSRHNLSGTIVSAFIRARKPKSLFKPGRDYVIRPAAPDDESEIINLLSSAGLTTAGVVGNMDQFTVADNGEIIGAIGMVPDDAGAVLLRSLIVKESYRNSGIADAMLQAVIKSGSGLLRSVYLMTNTAETYFDRRGYKKIERTDIPCVLLEKSLQGEACSDCSTCMKFEF